MITMSPGIGSLRSEGRLDATALVNNVDEVDEWLMKVDERLMKVDERIEKERMREKVRNK